MTQYRIPSYKALEDSTHISRQLDVAIERLTARRLTLDAAERAPLDQPVYFPIYVGLVLALPSRWMMTSLGVTQCGCSVWRAFEDDIFPPYKPLKP